MTVAETATDSPTVAAARPASTGGLRRSIQRLRPTGRLLALTLGWTLVALLIAFLPKGAHPLVDLLGLAFGGAVVLAALWDALSALRRPCPVIVERRVANPLALGEWAEVTVAVTPAEQEDGRRRFPRAGTIWDAVPDHSEVEGLPIKLPDPHSDRTVVTSYRLRPLRRGHASFGRGRLWCDSRWGLFEIRHDAVAAEVVRVLPNFRQLASKALMAVEDRAGIFGSRLQRQRGEGSDFRELRDYREGDLLRQIDWKATARRHKPISREYQLERDQHVVFLLDCSRRMAMRSGELEHFDHALNAALLVSWVALRQGDSVGLQTYGGPDIWLPPRKSAGALQQMLGRVFDLEPTHEASDLVSAARQLQQRQRRRALVVIVTDLRDEDASEAQRAVQLLEGRHLVQLASLREPAIDQLLEGPVDSFDDALERTATHLYLEGRDRLVAQLHGRGVHVLDVAPQRLPIALVHRYLEIKRAALL